LAGGRRSGAGIDHRSPGAGVQAKGRPARPHAVPPVASVERPDLLRWRRDPEHTLALLRRLLTAAERGDHGRA